MSIKIYNTLSRQKESFSPINPNQVQFYVCGPTVYNYIHIGNARSAVAFDTVRRYLEYRGYEVNYVSNFTDVDDKIIKAAQQEGLTPKELSDKYIAAYKEDTQAINIKPASVHPRVMDNIPEIIQFVADLIEKGFAYESDGDVYFRTHKFESYGKLSNKSIDELMSGASQRTAADETERKENPVDFALWKRTDSDQEISWDSPWGKGRPGWHIECSVMSTKYLGETLDIHGGGQDLEFPHHENEIAQSEAHSGHAFAKYWMHNGFVTIGSDDEKMSKSLGNFVLLRDLIQEVDPVIVRYLLGTVHYRKPLRYDDAALKEAKSNVEKIRDVFRRLTTRIENSETIETHTSDNKWQDELTLFENNFVQAMDDDFNAANGMTEILNIIKFANKYLLESNASSYMLNLIKEKLTTLLAIFGLIFDDAPVSLESRIEGLIEERQQARQARNFARADEIRDLLKAEGVLLDDTAQGTVWKKV